MNKCPKKCSGGNSTRQYELTEGQLKQISESAKLAINASRRPAYRCSYCGCVYINESSGARSLGSLNNAILGEGWHSRTYT